ncbi:MAG: hypothetical protein HFI06_03170 [Eubacterium sp.]|jgi:hypothetical protein|nr:hypothetical protein [Eubacterium sp.]NBI84982.1 hypothetical protein [Lachnospiraceae bacterium]
MNHKCKHIIAFLTGCLVLLWGSTCVFAAGRLSVAVSSGTVKTGDTVTVTVYAVNANNEDVIADMNITYDTSLLEYISSSDSDAGYGNGKITAAGSDVSIKFKAIASGDAYVKAEGAALTAAGTHINVTGGAETSPDDEGADANSVKSGDNSLSSLKISPGALSPAFKGSVTEYTAQVAGDVSEISVDAVTSNSKATIESISGNKDLKRGKNVITVLVKAENGTEAAYKITVSKGEGSTPASTDIPPASSEKTEGQEAQAGENSTTDGSGDSITIDGASYRISEEFSDEDIPAGFERADFEYKGKPYKGISFQHGHLGMYYLVNDAGESRFFVYDADRDKFFPYVRLNSGDHYIILMVVPNAAIPPDNYKEASVAVGDWATVSAYQFAGPADKEIVKFDNPEEEAAYNAESDFYLFYGMDDTGVSGWYQYDAKQGTYQRFNQDAIIPADTGKNYDMLLKSYNELDERYDDVRTRDRRLIGALIFVSVVLLLLVVNFILKVRELKLDEGASYHEEEKLGRKSRTKKTRTKKKNKTKNVGRAKEYAVAEEPEDGQGFYDADDRDIIDEFEEDPEIISSRKKKEKEARQEYIDVAPIRAKKKDTEDEDIEFLDLN